MKFALLVDLFPPFYVGGTEIGSYKFAKYLSKNGVDVHVLTSKDNYSQEQICIVENFTVHRFPMQNKSYLLKIYKQLRQKTQDMIYFLQY